MRTQNKFGQVFESYPETSIAAGASVTILDVASTGAGIGITLGLNVQDVAVLSGDQFQMVIKRKGVVQHEFVGQVCDMLNPLYIPMTVGDADSVQVEVTNNSATDQLVEAWLRIEVAP